MKTKFSGILTLFLAFVVQLTFAQEKTISGVVSDENSLPLPTATVLVKGTANGTSTDFDGNYSITAKSGDVLVFSYVGYADQEAIVGASNTVSVSLQLDSQLDEVVVTALGIQRKPDEITSSQQVVKAEVLTQAGNPNVVQSLAGKVSGLKINTTNNGVNQTTRIVLRGNRSLTGSNQALIVIDGAISSANTLANLAPEIIESTNVIKGAGGSALYGSQGSNGVIIVTTKKGTDGDKVRVAVNSSIQFERVSFVPKRQTKYGQGWNGGLVSYENGGWGPEFDGSIQPVGLAQADGSYIMAPYSPIEDNIKDFFQTGTIRQNGVTISGGTAKEGYALLSVNRQDTEFVVQDDKLGRTNVLFKAGKQIGKWSIEGNVNYVNSKTETTTSSLFTELLQTASNVPVSAFANSGNEGHWTSYYRSPYWMRDNIRNNSESDRFNGIVSLKYDINDNINVASNVSLRTFSSNADGYTNGYTDTNGVGGGDHTTVSTFGASNSESKNIYSDVFVNFNYMLTDDLSFKATLGNNIQDNMSSSTSVSGSNVTIPGYYNIDNVTGTPNVGNGTFRSRSYSFFGSVDLGYKDYLFMTLTGRNDWTSRLNSENNSFFYPSVGLSFIATEAFPELKSGVLKYAKISANVARVGNDRVGTYETNNVLVSSNATFTNGNSFGLDTSVADPFLVNEFIDSKEVGFRLGFFKGDRITLEGSFYKTNNKDLVTAVSTSTASGLSRSTVNVGETETKGFEIDLGLTPFRTKDLRWDVNFNISSDETIVKKVSDDTNEVSLGNGNADVGIFATVGEAFPLIKGTGYERDNQGRVLIDPSTGNPLKTSEFINLGVANPDYILGLSTSLTYKGFRLAGVFDYRTGHQFWAGTKDWLSWSGHLVESAENGRRGFIFPNSAIETSPGVYAANTSVVTGGTTYSNYLDYFSNEYRDVSENFVLDATAFKVRELSLSYSFNKKVLDAIGFSEFRIGVNARNPFVILPKENRNYADPEFANTSGNAQGLSVTGQYPATRTFGMSVNLTF